MILKDIEGTFYNTCCDCICNAALKKGVDEKIKKDKEIFAKQNSKNRYIQGEHRMLCHKRVPQGRGTLSVTNMVKYK